VIFSIRQLQFNKEIISEMASGVKTGLNAAYSYQVWLPGCRSSFQQIEVHLNEVPTEHCHIVKFHHQSPKSLGKYSQF